MRNYILSFLAVPTGMFDRTLNRFIVQPFAAQELAKLGEPVVIAIIIVVAITRTGTIGAA
jgi:hypothetical protein